MGGPSFPTSVVESSVRTVSSLAFEQKSLLVVSRSIRWEATPCDEKISQEIDSVTNSNSVSAAGLSME